jgi:hypothetical protein
MKAGVLDKAMERRLSKASAYAEAAGYAANIALNLHRVRVLQLQELVLKSRAVQTMKVRGPPRRLERFGQELHSQTHAFCNEKTLMRRLPCQPTRRPRSWLAPGPAQQQTQPPRLAAACRDPQRALPSSPPAAPQDGAAHSPEALRRIAALRSQRTLRTAFIVQDISDALLALSDITDGRYSRLSHPVVLALAGLVSAAVSSYKNWPG